MFFNWTLLCGSNFVFLENNSLGICFSKMISLCCFTFMSAVCMFYCAQTRRDTFIRTRFSTLLINLRIVFMLVLLCTPVLKDVFLVFVTKQKLYPVDHILYTCQSFSFATHLFYLLRLRKNITRNIRGTPFIWLALFLVASSEILCLWGNFTCSFSTDVLSCHLIASCLLISCIVCYCVTLIPTGVMPSYYGYSVINEDADEQIYSSSRSYGTFYEEQNAFDLGVAEEENNLLSKLTFWWVRKLMVKGSKGLIKTECDLYDLPTSLKTETVVNRIQNYCRSVSFPALSSSVEELRFLESLGSESTTTSGSVAFRQRRLLLINILNKCFGLEFYFLGIIRFLADASSFAGPIFLNYLINFIESNVEPVRNGYLYFLGLSLSALVSAFLSAHFNFLVNRVGLKVRAAVIYLIYQKSLNVNTCTLSTFDTGEIVNFMSTDTDRIVNFCQSFHQFWSLPVQIIIALVLLHQQIGLSFLAGFAFAVLLIPINKWLANKIAKLSTEWLDRKDKRIKFISELLSGIRVVKMHAWEGQFAAEASLIRQQELKFLKSRKYLDAFCVYFWATTPVIISVLTFTMYTALGNSLTAAKVFTCLSLFNLLITPLNAFPWVINGIIEAWVSLKRVQQFLLLQDTQPHEYYSSLTNSSNSIEVIDGQFSWNAREEEDGSFLFSSERSFLLGPLNVKIERGQFYGIVGVVGSGKSSFLSAVLAELYLRHGSVAMNRQSSHGAGSSTSSQNSSFQEFFGGVGYAAQEPWIQHGTIQQNILFGKPFNVFKYNHVLEACALLDDLQLLPSGDQTEVGERGVTLSGGQKARISLARAIYQDFDIYLLDDPFAAVDINVAQHIYQYCIRGLLQGKTVILCTHHLQYLKDADSVLVLKDGRPISQGLPSDVLPANMLELNDSPGLASQSGMETVIEKSVDFQPAQDNQLVQEEERESGSLKWAVYTVYAKAVGPFTALVVILSMFLMQGSKVSSDWWLAYWVSDLKSQESNLTSYTDGGPPSGQNMQFYLLVFGGIAILNSIFTLIRAFTFAYGGIQAAVKIHNALLSTVLKAPVRFFDVTPMGRILNRFSSDLNMIDDSLPFIFNIFLAQLFGVLGSLVITCYGLPWMILALIPLAVKYLFIQNYYRYTSRELKRLYSTTLSPLYAHFTETLVGLTTIKAMAATRRFAHENEDKLDANQQASFAGICASQWLMFNLQMIGVLLVTAVSLLAVLQHQYYYVDPGLVGLVVSYALSITALLNGVVSSFTETEKELISVERVMQYIEGIRPEKRLGIMTPPSVWPLHGVVTFKQVKLRYHPTHPLALQGVTFETKPGEKIGIVGRTGSGKSSLFQALFRIVELEEGEIFIDGVNVALLDLHTLRSHLAIIPQDPFLFSGTVKSNLDPGRIHSDHELLQVLRHCQMVDTVNQMGGLTALVTERGQQFSVGQRQLLCLARALLARTKILCIDEATASVDSETDQAVQKTLRTSFKNTTVMTIAHRIDTILDSDRLLVMSSGALVESGKPQNLMNNPTSVFSTFVLPKHK